jgi:hypothetical protein
MLSGAIIGGIIGLITVLLVYYFKNQKFKKLAKTVQNAEYAALYHYASYTRYNKSMKFFDSYGLLYIIGKNLYYKAGENETPMVFDLTQCTAQQEPDWRKLKWFSITTPVGEKHYFNSHKMGAIVHNSEETLKGLAVIKAKTAEASRVL